MEVPRSGLPVKHRSLPDFESRLQETRVIEERPTNENGVKRSNNIDDRANENTYPYNVRGIQLT